MVLEGQNNACLFRPFCGFLQAVDNAQTKLVVKGSVICMVLSRDLIGGDAIFHHDTAPAGEHTQNRSAKLLCHADLLLHHKELVFNMLGNDGCEIVVCSYAANFQPLLGGILADLPAALFVQINGRTVGTLQVNLNAVIAELLCGVDKFLNGECGAIIKPGAGTGNRIQSNFHIGVAPSGLSTVI